jgi:hypothetical protein
LGIVCDELLDASDAAAPDVLELDEHRGDRADRLDLAVRELFAAVAPFAEQAGALEDGDVLLHRGERHVVVRGQGRDGVLPDQDASQDVATGAVGEGVEQRIGAVLLGVRDRATHRR